MPRSIQKLWYKLLAIFCGVTMCMIGPPVENFHSNLLTRGCKAQMTWSTAYHRRLRLLINTTILISACGFYLSFSCVHVYNLSWKIRVNVHQGAFTDKRILYIYASRQCLYTLVIRTTFAALSNIISLCRIQSTPTS